MYYENSKNKDLNKLLLKETMLGESLWRILYIIINASIISENKFNNSKSRIEI